jgi:hypothetical protein
MVVKNGGRLTEKKFDCLQSQTTALSVATWQPIALPGTFSFQRLQSRCVKLLSEPLRHYSKNDPAPPNQAIDNSSVCPIYTAGNSATHPFA